MCPSVMTSGPPRRISNSTLAAHIKTLLKQQGRAAVALPDNVLFFERKSASETPWVKKLWLYDLCTNQHFTLKTNPLRREHLEEFVKLHNPANRHDRKATWSAEPSTGSGRTGGGTDPYDYADLIAQEIVADLQAALEQFKLIAEDLSTADTPVQV